MERAALVTGSAGFIGSAVSQRLLDEGYTVVGIDCLSDYYDPGLKRSREERLLCHERFTARHERVEKPGVLREIMGELKPAVVIHLAAQAGVRYSIDEPSTYVDSNLRGTFELLEAARAHPPRHMLMASSSSVYGYDDDIPYCETAPANHQLSFYAATKKANEAMAHSYAHMFGIPITIFRFFTVYGPWGRPDMALFKFVRAMLAGEEFEVYGFGKMRRDYTFIADLVEAIYRLIEAVPIFPQSSDTIFPNDSLSPVAPWRVVNIGNSSPVVLLDMIETAAAALNIEPRMKLMEIQPGEVQDTWADTALLKALTGFACQTDVQTGVRHFVDWYREYYQV